MAGASLKEWDRFLETGLYTVPIAARLIAAKPTKVRSWLDGYSHSGAQPIIHRQLPRVGGKTCLGFLDLIETAFIRHFLSIGYSPQTIRKVALKLRDRHDVEHPLAMNKRFKADGKSIFEEAVQDDGERRLLNLMNDNFEIVPAVEPSLFDQVFYVEDIAREWTPIHIYPNVIVNPRISFGRPALKDSRVPTETVMDFYKVEGDINETAAEFGISEAEVNAALNFERDLDKRTVH